MKKEEFIKRRGKAAYEKWQQQTRDWDSKHRKEKRENSRKWYRTHPEEARERKRLWRLNHPDKVREANHENGRKGGKYYERMRKYESTGLPHERKLIRRRHAHRYHPLKRIIAPDSQLHHQWLPNSANYTGVALVEADQHLHGFVDVIRILEGDITLLTEEEVRNGGGTEQCRT